MRHLSFFILSLILIIALPVSAFAAFGLPFGGTITSQPVPCANIPGAFQMMILDRLFGVVPFPESLIWSPPPSTITFLSGPPTHVGQKVLGEASPTPTTCVVAGVPIPGLLMQFVGTNLL